MIGACVSLRFNVLNAWMHSSEKLNGYGNLEITSIFALSTSIPEPKTLCQRMIPSFTMKWHFSQFNTRDLKISRKSIKETVVFVPSQSFEHLIDKRKWKVVFPDCVVQLTIVDTHAPTGDYSLWDKFFLLIIHHGHPSFLWNNLDRAYPGTVRDRIDQPDIKEFYELLFYNFFDIGVNSSSGLDAWFKFFFHEDFVGTKGRVDSLNVSDTPSDRPFVISKNLKESIFSLVDNAEEMTTGS
ncbi:hypothetical protein Tco_0703456 [Tanacetum coccineum]|uniref:Uncharacterized protein n=1 Tax=Tanacetum coccineum TaxID=301880 RepID=A0ABQ4Y0P2_9ASTR